MERTPYYKEMAPGDLRAAYREERINQSNWNRMATPGHGRRNRSRIAGGVLRATRRIDLIVNVARKRGIILKEV